jgi:hypothetical protein
VNSEHPDLETLADIADSDDPAALSPTASVPDAVREHIAGCAACTADLAALRHVRETLRSLPPVPMPPEVADRLEAALLAARVPVGNITPFTSREATETARTARIARWRTLPLSAVAAVVVFAALIVGGVVGLGHVGNNSEKRASSAAAPAAAATSADLTTIASGTSYTSDQLRAQVAAIVSSRVPGAAQRYPGLNDPDLVTAAAAASSAPAAAAASESAAAPAASAAPSAPAAAAPTAAVGPVFAAPASSAAAAGGVAHSDAFAPNLITTPTGPLADPAALARCIQTLAGKAEQPVLVDYATFDGVPSTIIVFADPDIANKLDIYVEANTANCATQVTFAAFLPAPVDSSP